MYRVVDSKYLRLEDGLELLVEIPHEDLRSLDEVITEALLSETKQNAYMLVRYYPALTSRSFP